MPRKSFQTQLSTPYGFVKLRILVVDLPSELADTIRCSRWESTLEAGCILLTLELEISLPSNASKPKPPPSGRPVCRKSKK